MGKFTLCFTGEGQSWTGVTTIAVGAGSPTEAVVTETSPHGPTPEHIATTVLLDVGVEAIAESEDDTVLEVEIGVPEVVIGGRAAGLIGHAAETVEGAARDTVVEGALPRLHLPRRTHRISYEGDKKTRSEKKSFWPPASLCVICLLGAFQRLTSNTCWTVTAN